MSYITFNRKTSRTVDGRSFVADVGPVFVPPKDGAPGYWIPGSGHYTTTSSSSPFNATSGFRSSDQTPFFKSPKRSFLLRSLAFDYSKTDSSASGFTRNWTTPTSVSNGPGSASYRDSTSWYSNVFSWGPVADPTPGWINQLQSKAASNLLKNLRDSSVNLAQAVAERKQTANLVASSATKIAGALLQLRRGNFTKAAQNLGVLPKVRAGRRFNSQFAIDQAKAVGNGWLELQYGWKPLLSDVYGSMEALAKANNPQGNPNTIFQKTTARATRNENVTERTKRALSPGYSGIDETIRTGTFQVQVKTGVTFSVSSPALSSLAKVGITNPALLAWELIPYSFVVDWFLPIGNYLESLDATNGLTFQDGYVTTLVRKQFNTTNTTSLSYSLGTQNSYILDVEEIKVVTCKRVVLSGFPAMPVPSFKNPLSSSHVKSAMALLLQLKR